MIARRATFVQISESYMKIFVFIRAKKLVFKRKNYIFV